MKTLIRSVLLPGALLACLPGACETDAVEPAGHKFELCGFETSKSQLTAAHKERLKEELESVHECRRIEVVGYADGLCRPGAKRDRPTTSRKTGAQRFRFTVAR